MPWKSMEDVPPSIKKHKGISLTLEQANKWGEIYDAVKSKPNLKEPAAIAWSTWEEVYALEGDHWVKRKREKAEALLIIEEIAAVESMTNGEDGLPNMAKVVLITAGPCKTKKRTYKREALVEAINENIFDNLQMFDAHPPGSEVIPGATQTPRKVSELMSYVIPGTVKYDENIVNPVTKEKTGGVVAETELVDEDFRKNFKKKAKIIGPSVNSLCKAICKDGQEIVTKIIKGISADWVTRPNAGGMVLEVVEAESESEETLNSPRKEVRTMVLEKWENLTIDMLRSNCPQIVEQILEQTKKDAENKTAEALKAANAAKAEAEQAKNNADVAKKEMAEQASKSAEIKKTIKVAEMIETKCGQLNAFAKAIILKTLVGKEFADEKEMAEAIDSEIAKIKTSKNTPASGSSEQDPKPAMPKNTLAYAESLGYSQEEIKRLASVR